MIGHILSAVIAYGRHGDFLATLPLKIELQAMCSEKQYRKRSIIVSVLHITYTVVAILSLKFKLYYLYGRS